MTPEDEARIVNRIGRLEIIIGALARIAIFVGKAAGSITVRALIGDTGVTRIESDVDIIKKNL